jgi:hypothetical protein
VFVVVVVVVFAVVVFVVVVFVTLFPVCPTDVFDESDSF